MTLSDLTDPWSNDAQLDSSTNDGPSFRQLLLVVVLGAGGIFAQVWRDAPHARWTIGAVALVAAACMVVLRSDPGRSWRTATIWPLMLLVVLLVARTPIGSATMLLTYVGVSVAYAAAVAWRPVPRWPSRSSAVAGLAFPLLIASQMIWFRAISGLAALGLMGLSLAVVEAYHRRPAPIEAVERRLTAGLTALGSAMGVAVVAVVALVVLYLPGLVVRAFDSLRHVWGPEWSERSWRPYDISVAEERRDAHRIFASTPRSVRLRRNLAHAAALALVLAGSGVAMLLVGPDPSDQIAVARGDNGLDPENVAVEPMDGERSILALEFATPYSALPAYAGTAWADELQIAEQGGAVPTAGLHTVDEGLRRTRKPTDCSECPRATMWLSGGSAVYGIGQRDDHTIASELVRVAETAGIALEVANLGRNGATTFEEVLQIEERLRTGPSPDLIVFYNGWNDVVFEVAFRFAVGPDADRLSDVNAMGHIAQINERPQEFLRSKVGPAAGRRAAGYYRAMYEQAVQLAESAGSEVAFFFQADALASARQLEGYDELTNVSSQELLRSPFAQALEAATSDLDELGVVNLRPLFAHYPEPVFLGLVHHNEAGAAQVAMALFDELEPQLRSRAH